MNLLISTLISVLLIWTTSIASQQTKNYYFVSEQNADDEWSSREELTNRKEEFNENNDFKFDDQSTFKDSEEEEKDAANELYQFWNNIDMCNDVSCKSEQVCVINQENVAVCVSKRKVERETVSKNKKQCNQCPNLVTNDIYCASNNRSYSSLCELVKHNCEQSTDYHPLCQDECPCNRKLNLNKKLKLDYLWKYVNNFQSTKRTDRRTNGLNAIRRQAIGKQSKDRTIRQRANVCSTKELNEIGQRLYNWFAVIMKNQLNDAHSEQRSTKQIVTKIRASLLANCDEEVNFMFLNLDTNRDLKLSLDELYHLEHDQREKCLKTYMDACDTNDDQVLNNNEWCTCFLRYRPCLKERASLSNNRLSNKLSISYLPNCDQNGDFEAMQCNRFTKFCWCVDKTGNEIANTKKLGKVLCDKLKSKNSTPHPIDDDSEGDDDFEDYQSEGSGDL